MNFDSPFLPFAMIGGIFCGSLQLKKQKGKLIDSVEKGISEVKGQIEERVFPSIID